MRRAIAVLVLLLGLALTPSAHAVDLKRGQPVFWDGKGATADYDLNVVERGFRLRVGFDHYTLDDIWHIELKSPGGQVEQAFTPGAGLYSAEGVVEDPVPGKWTVSVRGGPVTDPRFRMRALVENSPPPVTKREAALPNLQALPPWDFKFLFPITNGGLQAGPSTGVPTAGRATCHPEEVAENRAVRCLRTAFGVANTGQGPMELHYEAPSFSFADADLYQRIHYTDGTIEERPAGKAVYHRTHQHYHHDQAISLQLFRVVADGKLEPVGAEQRKGFAHRNELLRDWKRFYPIWEEFGFGLRSGWGDYYEWDRPGNYIDLGLEGDGRFVVRMTADPVAGILESNELDNTSYTMFEVALDQAKWLESGRGTDPWDRCKIPLGYGPEPDPAAPLRPADCPPDTTWLPEPASAPPVKTKSPAKKSTKKKKASKKRKCRTKKQRKSKRCRKAKRRRKR